MADIWDNVVRDLMPELHLAVQEQRTNRFITEKVGSPIEHALIATLDILLTLRGLDVRYARTPHDIPIQGAFIEPQAQIGNYRVDLLVGIFWPGSAPDLKDCVVIECDGHEWHEKTREQAARDKARDRYIQGEVHKVIHFTGSEIFRSPGTCANEAWKFMMAAYGNAMDKLPRA